MRDPRRAKLMLYCWQVSRGELAPGGVPVIDGCTIRWDHGDAAKSRAAAREMVKRFNIASQPSLGVSLHTKGRAIDMTITWAGTMSIRDADGATHAIGAPHSAETNTTLQNVGRSYGVIKLIRPSKPDVPHWSDNGT